MPRPPPIIEPSDHLKAITLVIYPDGHFSVRAPADSDNSAVQHFIRENEEWIEKQRSSFKVSGLHHVNRIMIGKREVPYTITYQGVRKKKTILVHFDGRVEVRVPEGTAQELAIAFLEKEVEWVRQIIEGGQKAREPEISPYSVTWNDKVIPYTLRISERARRLSIKVLADRSVEVVAPVGMADIQIEHLVREKGQWIYTAVMSDERPVAVRRSFCDGETYPFLGGTLAVRVTRGTPGGTVSRNGLFINVGLPNGMIRSLEQNVIRRAVEYIMKDETHKVVIPLVTHYAAKFGVAVPPVGVRNARKKWGSCIGRKRLLFSTHLCMLPIGLIHYVVAHEVCHMVIMDHSGRFWDSLMKVMPDCRERAAELKRDSPLYQLLPA